MEIININFPKKIVFGNNCTDQFIEDFKLSGRKRAFILTTPFLEGTISKLKTQFNQFLLKFAMIHLHVFLPSFANRKDKQLYLFY